MDTDTLKQETNTQTNGNGHVHMNGRLFGSVELAANKSATWFEDERICTFVYAKMATWGEPVFWVEQSRLGLNGQLTKLFRPEDLQNVIRGAYKAQQWIKKRQRGLRWRDLVAAGLL